MKRLKFIRNKYVISFILFLVYILFLDNVDIFSIFRQESRLHKIQKNEAAMLQKYNEAKATLDQLDNTKALAKYAREKKLFKKDNEDLFVIVNKDKID